MSKFSFVFFALDLIFKYSSDFIILVASSLHSSLTWKFEASSSNSNLNSTSNSIQKFDSIEASNSRLQVCVRV